MRCSVDGISYRSSVGIDDAIDREPSCTRTHICFEIDGSEKRFIHLGDRAGEDIEVGRTRFLLLATQDRQQGIPLLFGCTFIDDRKSLAVALVDRTGPCEESDPLQAIEGNRAEVALFDLHRRCGTAIAMGRQTVELAWATPSAVTCCDLGATDIPIDVRHCFLLSRRAIWLPISEPTFSDRRLIRTPCGNAIQLSRLSTTPDRPSWWGNFLAHPLTCELVEIRAPRRPVPV